MKPFSEIPAQTPLCCLRLPSVHLAEPGLAPVLPQPQPVPAPALEPSRTDARPPAAGGNRITTAGTAGDWYPPGTSPMQAAR